MRLRGRNILVSFPDYLYGDAGLCAERNVEPLRNPDRVVPPYGPALAALVRLCRETTIYAIRRPEIITSDGLARFYLPAGWTKLHIHLTDDASVKFLRGAANLGVFLPTGTGRVLDWMGFLGGSLAPMALRLDGLAAPAGLDLPFRRVGQLMAIAAVAAPEQKRPQPFGSSRLPLLYPFYINPYSVSDTLGWIRHGQGTGRAAPRVTLLRATDAGLRCRKRSEAVFAALRPDVGETVWLTAPEELAPRSHGLSIAALVDAQSRWAAPLPRTFLPNAHLAAVGALATSVDPDWVYQVLVKSNGSWSARPVGSLPGCDRLCGECASRR